MYTFYCFYCQAPIVVSLLSTGCAYTPTCTVCGHMNSFFYDSSAIRTITNTTVPVFSTTVSHFSSSHSIPNNINYNAKLVTLAGFEKEIMVEWPPPPEYKEVIQKEQNYDIESGSDIAGTYTYIIFILQGINSAGIAYYREYLPPIRKFDLPKESEPDNIMEDKPSRKYKLDLLKDKAA